MKNHKTIIFVIFLATSYLSNSQNLPSLLTQKNINATFSITAYDANTKEFGIAVATDNIYVGNSTIYIEPGIGAFSVIAETEPKYGIEGIKKLKEGKSIEASINEVRNEDRASNYRQVGGIDANGNVSSFTGQSLKYWKGQATEILGSNYVVMGNQLAENVLSEMANTFENSTGTLAERLMKSLKAGQDAGGQISGKQSAAIAVKGSDNEWFNQIDLRVDNSKNPIEELQTLVNYHYGRIHLNQSLFALRSDNITRAKQKLTEAESMLDGWTGMYSRIAYANVLLKNESKAVHWIKKGLAENPNWAVNISAFYFLKDHPEMKSIIDPNSFTIKDWESALSMFSNLGRELDLIALAKKFLNKKIESSYLNYLLGRAYSYEKENDKAIKYLEKALRMDGENIEAQNLLGRIKA